MLETTSLGRRSKKYANEVVVKFSENFMLILLLKEFYVLVRNLGWVNK